MSLSGEEKQKAHEAGHKWAKEEAEENVSPIHIRWGREEIFSVNNKERSEAFDAGVTNYNETIARNKADSFSFVPESRIKDRSSDTGNTSSRNDDPSDDSPDDDDLSSPDDSPTNYTSSTPVSPKKESGSGSLLGGAPFIVKFLYLIAVSFILVNFAIDLENDRAQDRQKKVRETITQQAVVKDTAQAPPDEEEKEPAYDTIFFKNECDENIYVAVHYAPNANTDDWITEGWWEILAHKKEALNIHSYGESIDFFGMKPGSEWNGNNQPNAALLTIVEGNSFSHGDGQDYTDQNLRQVTFRKIYTGKSYGDVLTVLGCGQ